MKRTGRLWAPMVSWLVAAPAMSAGTATPPQLDTVGLHAWAEYQKQPPHRAFAIAPGGAWGWRAGLSDAGQVQDEAIAECRESTEIACLPYDLNGRSIFNDQRWAESLSPYPDPKAPTSVGAQRGQRFPPLRILDRQGQPVPLTGDAITVLHFWGSWCPPCVHEMPELVRFQARMRNQAGLRFLFIPLREPLADAQAWLKIRKLDPPLYQAATASGTGTLLLTDGRQYPDRQISPAFPTTYILDRQGVILFAHQGPIHNWDSWAPILKHAALNAPR